MFIYIIYTLEHYETRWFVKISKISNIIPQISSTNWLTFFIYSGKIFAVENNDENI